MSLKHGDIFRFIVGGDVWVAFGETYKQGNDIRIRCHRYHDSEHGNHYISLFNYNDIEILDDGELTKWLLSQ